MKLILGEVTAKKRQSKYKKIQEKKYPLEEGVIEIMG